MEEIKEGDVVIVSTGQIGTVLFIDKDKASVLLATGFIWYGRPYDMRFPQNDDDVEFASKEIDRWE